MEIFSYIVIDYSGEKNYSQQQNFLIKENTLQRHILLDMDIWTWISSRFKLS